jgi:hypothetical protein
MIQIFMPGPGGMAAIVWQQLIDVRAVSCKSVKKEKRIKKRKCRFPCDGSTPIGYPE